MVRQNNLELFLVQRGAENDQPRKTHALISQRIGMSAGGANERRAEGEGQMP